MSGDRADVDLTSHAGWAEITLTNVDQRNALTQPMLRMMATMIESLTNDGSTRAVIIRGSGNFFSSGYAIDRFPTPEQLPVIDDIEKTCQLIERTPMVFVAATDGGCIGAALNLASACDIRVSTKDCMLGIPAARLGIVYSVDGTRRVSRALGPAATRYLLLTGALVPASSHLVGDFVSVLVDNAVELTTTAARLAENVAQTSALSIAGAKQILAAIDEMTQFDDVERAALHRLRQQAIGSPESTAAVAAFLSRGGATVKRQA